MKEEKHIINTLELERPSLSQEERLAMWNVIERQIPVPASVPSPFLSLYTYKTIMTPLIVLLILVLGGGGTALASDASKPGDFLFPVERAIEDAQLRLAFSEDAKNALTQTFTEERLRELRDIIDEEIVVDSTNITPITNVSTSSAATSTMLKIEATVYTDRTIIKLELNSQKFYFEATSDTREGVILEILERFSVLTRDQIDAQLDFEIEDRESRPKDRGVVSISSEGEVRIAVAVEAILQFLEGSDIDTVKKSDLLSLLSSEVEGVTQVRRDNDQIKIGSEDTRYEIRMNDDGDSRLEFRDGQSRIRIEEKDGEIRVKTSNGYDDDAVSENSVRSSLSTIATSSLAFEVEADVFTDVTVIKIEIGDENFVFETDAQTRSEVIAEIQSRFPVLSNAQIDAQLNFEIEDRTHRTEDGAIGTDNVRDSDDDEDLSGKNRDDEDDSSGRDDDDSSGKNHKDSDDDDRDDDEDDSSGRDDDDN